MIEFYRYLHYRLYAWGLRTWGRKDGPEWNALIAVTVLMFANIFTVYVLLGYFGVLGSAQGDMPRVKVLGSYGLLLVINYLLFLQNARYLAAAKRYSGESARKRRGKAILLWVYAIGSLVSPFCIASLEAFSQ